MVSPGLILAGIYVYVLYEIHGKVSMWWVWLSALAIYIVVDTLLGYYVKRVISLPTKKVVTRDGD